MGLFRGAAFHHDRRAGKQPIKQPIETPTSTMTLMGRLPFLMGRFTEFALIQKYPQYCWEFHDRLWEAPPVLGGREFWKFSGAFKCLEW